jgi:hypothetical protein
MTWIRIVPPAASPEVRAAMDALQKMYPREYDAEHRHERDLPDLVRRDSVMMSHSLLPEVMRHAFGTFGALMDGSLPLTRRQQEMIATTVSVLNRCYF